MPRKTKLVTPTVRFAPARNPDDIPTDDLRRSGSTLLGKASYSDRIATSVGWIAASLPGVEGLTMIDALMRAWDDLDPDRKVKYVVAALGLNNEHLDVDRLQDVLNT